MVSGFKTIAYPSEDFPNPPPVFLTAPDSWIGIHVAGALIALVETEEFDGPRSSVVVRAKTRLSATTFAEYFDNKARAIVNQHGPTALLTKELEDGAPDDLTVGVLGLGALGAEPIEQWRFYYDGPAVSERHHSVIEVVASCAVGRAETWALLFAIASSVIVLDYMAPVSAGSSES